VRPRRELTAPATGTPAGQQAQPSLPAGAATHAAHGRNPGVARARTASRCAPSLTVTVRMGARQLYGDASRKRWFGPTAGRGTGSSTPPTGRRGGPCSTCTLTCKACNVTDAGRRSHPRCLYHLRSGDNPLPVEIDGPGEDGRTGSLPRTETPVRVP